MPVRLLRMLFNSRTLQRLCITGLVAALAAAPLNAQEAQPVESSSPPQQQGEATKTRPRPREECQTGYIINFNNVGITEYLRFIGKITGTNFVFNPQELNFNVTIVSEEPASIDSIMSILLQVLEVHGLSMTEQQGQVLIYRDAKLAKLSTVISDREAAAGTELPPIVTRVFSVTGSPPEGIAEIVGPLLSPQALVQVSKATGHLIVTDIAGNIEKVASLLESLVSPSPNLDIGQYQAQYVVVSSLVALAQRILDPLGEGVVTLVPQETTDTVYIISTPFLIDRTISILQMLDRTSSPEGGWDAPIGSGGGGGEGVTIPSLEPGLPTHGTFGGTGEGFVPLSGGFGGTGEGAEPIGGTFGGGGEPVEPMGGSFSGSGLPELAEAAAMGEFPYYGGRGVGVETSPQERIIPARPEFGEELPFRLRARGEVDNTTFYIYKLQYHQGDEIVTALQNIATSLQEAQGQKTELISTIGTIQWLEATNSLVISGPRSAIERVRMLIEQLDIPLKQVLIEALVIRTTVTNSLAIGVEWGGRVTYQGRGGTPNIVQGGTGSMRGEQVSLLEPLLNTTTGPSQVPLPEGFDLGAVGRFVNIGGRLLTSVGAIINALQTDSQTKVLLNPKLLTQDNHPARMFSGINRAFQDQTIGQPGSENVSTDFVYRDIGSELRITPLIGNSDIITLDIEQSISTDISQENLTRGNQLTSTNRDSLTELFNGFDQQDFTPTISKSEMHTRVSVPDGYFLLLAAQINDANTKEFRGLPCLGSLPLIGTAFSFKRNRDERDNLILLVRPHIIRTKADMVRVTEAQSCQYERYSNQRQYRIKAETLYDILNVGQDRIPSKFPCYDPYLDGCPYECGIPRECDAQ